MDEPRLLGQRRLQQIAVVLSLVVALAAVIVLVGGWWLDVEVLRKPFAASTAMRAGTAAGLLVVAVGLANAGLRGPRQVTAVAGALAVLDGGAAITGYLVGADRSVIEALLAGGVARDAAEPGRIAVNTAACLLALGIGLLLLAVRRGSSTRQGIGLAVFLVGYAALLGYVMSTAVVAGRFLPGYTEMALQTALPITALGVSLVVVDLDVGWARILVEPLAGGRVVRTFLPALLGIFLVAGIGYAHLTDDEVAAASGGALVLAGLAVIMVIGLLVLAARLERVSSTLEGLSEDLEERVASRTLDVQEALALLRAQFEGAPNGIVLLGAGDRILDVNEALCRLIGREREDLLGSNLTAVAVTDDQPASRTVLAENEGSGARQRRWRHRDGHELWVEETLGIARDSQGHRLAIVCEVVDVTEQRAAARMLAESESLLRTVLDTSTDAVVRFSPGGRIDYANQSALDLSGQPPEAWVRLTLAELADSLGPEWSERVDKVFATGEPEVFSFQLELFTGPTWWEASLSPEFDTHGTVTHVVSTSRDVTERVQATQRLAELATFDALTGLANRSVLLDEVSRALATGRRAGTTTAVMMIDLDHFKNVNDTLGHSMGDTLLQAAGRRLTDTIREGDLVGRLGGDEFLVIMRDALDVTVPVRVGQRIVEAFRKPLGTDETGLYSTASIGIAMSTPTSTAEELVRDADAAMYLSKHEGRDRVSVFNEDLRAGAAARLSLEGDLRQALDSDQLALWFQPEVELATGAVIAAEGLLRWHHPSGSTLTADRFIGIAEETGLILPIGEWVIEQACRQAAEWAREWSAHPRGKGPVVRVNLSALQLSEPALLATLDSAMTRTGAPSSLLCVELTETTLLRETEAARRNLRGLRERGLTVAIDDFGTGYASLTYLHRYPVDVVKVDRSFVADIMADSYDRRLVAGIVALAREVGVSVTAEGVEEPEQARTLIELGCPSAQGYLYSPAIPASDLRERIRDGYPTF